MSTISRIIGRVSQITTGADSGNQSGRHCGPHIGADLSRGIGLALCLALAASPLFGADLAASSGKDSDTGPSRIELTDGSIVIGEVLGMRDGIYSVRIPSLGTLGIESSRIRAIGQASAPSDHAIATGQDAGLANPGSDYSAQVESMQRQLLGNADLMQMIVGLQNDPALQRAMADPELMRLISSGNLDALREHPGFRELMTHPGIRAIIDQVQ